jgi:hypothetical protein
MDTLGLPNMREQDQPFVEMESISIQDSRTVVVVFLEGKNEI